MIRPFTIVCMLMAVGSGLYLYQCKHQAQVLDREISRTLKQTEAARDRIGMLRAEWAQLNEPQRVAELAHEHSGLQNAKPTQFIAVSDLANKLPAPVAPSHQSLPTDVPDDAEATRPIAQAEPTAPAPRMTTSAAPDARPTQPEIRPAVHAQVIAEPKPAAPAAVAELKPARHGPAATTPAPVATATLSPSTPPQAAAVHSVARTIVPPRAVASASAPSNADAVAPGTVGASVLRAMRAREISPREEATYVQPVAAPARSYPPPSAPQPVAPQPIAPSYAPQAYAPPPSGSMLGGARGSLPPPVPFAAR